MSVIEVVAGVIIIENRILLTQRSPARDFPYRWESPGGKVEGNESHHDALRRELREEIGVEATGFNQSPIWCGKISRTNADPVFVLLYRAWLALDSKPRLMEDQIGIGWFSHVELASLLLMPGNSAALPIMAGGLLR